jgi:hypothetical protein
LFAWGDRPAAEAARDEHRALLDRTDDPMIQIRSIAMDTWFAFVDGRLEENLTTARQLVAFGASSGSHQLAQGHARGLTKLSLIYMGLPDDEIAAPLPPRVPNLPSGLSSQRHAYFGCLADARQTVRGNVERWVTERTLSDIPQRALLSMLEASVLAGDGEMAAVLSMPVEGCDLMLGSSGIFEFTGVARHLGGTAALLGDTERARGYYTKALELSEKARFRPEIALTHLQIAELLVNDGVVARVHLERAISELKEMKMRLPLERALRLQTTLQGR